MFVVGSLVALYAICASTFTVSKAALAYTTPTFLLTVRMLVAGSLLLGYAYWRHGWAAFPRKTEWWLFTQIALFHCYGAYMFDLWSLQYLASVESALLYNISPFLSALFSFWLFNERMTRNKWLGLFIGLCGFIPSLIAQYAQACAVSHRLWPWPELALIAGIACAMYGWVVMRTLVRDHGYQPTTVNGVGMFASGILALMTSWYVDGFLVVPVSEWQTFVPLTLLLILLANLIFNNFYGYLLHYYTATLLSFAGFLCPLCAALFGWFWLSEAITWHLCFSLVIVCIGLYIFYQEELRQGYVVDISARSPVS
jgi:drug/metabolite transporter (DMT)-like permease